MIRLACIITSAGKSSRAKTCILGLGNLIDHGAVTFEFLVAFNPEGPIVRIH